MFERVVVIGAGAAGVAAAWAAAQRGAQLRVLDGGPGASALGGGAVDDRPWEELARSAEVLDAPARARPLPEAVHVFAADLGLWQVAADGAPPVRLCTEAGRVRLARGRDRSLLDLEALPRGARVLLPRVERPEWDADALARALEEDAWARSRHITFSAVDADLLKLVGEDRIPAADLASRHEAADRADWLVERLRAALARAGRGDALLLGPWLGVREPLAPRVSAALGMPVGEIVAAIGGPAGLRFEAARRRLFDGLGIEIEPQRATVVADDDGDLRVITEDGRELTADAAVLAVGGVAGGGVVYDPPEHDAGQDFPEQGRVPFRLSLEAAVEMGVRGRRIDVVGSVHGPALDHIAWPVDADPSVLEAVGVRCDGVRAGPSTWAAGDVIADRPRTLLEAVWSGVLAGVAAAGEPGSIVTAR
jgi:glycerol-3-phosphate dehydrogenase subunit B